MHMQESAENMHTQEPIESMHAQEPAENTHVRERVREHARAGTGQRQTMCADGRADRKRG